MAARKAEEAAPQETADQSAGVWVAKEALYVGGSRAFAPGDIVPAEHVERFEWRDKVRAFDDNESED